MKKLILLLLAISAPAFASTYNATAYNYITQVTQGNAATGASSIRANPTAFAQGIPFLPYNMNAPVSINRNAATAETITPTAISNCYSNSLTCTISGSFTYKHIAGENIQSGTFGLQEAINVAIAAGSGTVLIDASWQGPTGSSLITAASGSTTVMVQDNRNPAGAVFYQWNGSAYVAQSGGAGVPSVFGRTGAVTAQTGDYTCAQVTNCGSGVQSINGDTTSAQHFAATGTGLSVATSGGVTTYALAGGGLTGTVNSAAAHAIGEYPATGTAIGGATALYTVDPGMTVAQLNTLFTAINAALPGTVIIPDGVTTGPGIINTNVGVYSVAKGDTYLQSRRYGVACDAQGLFLTFTQGSNQVFVGSDPGIAVGKSFFVAARSSYAYGATQWAWEPTITAINTGTQFATLSSNAPFSYTGWVGEGTDDTARAQAMLNDAGYVFPVTIPAGCKILTQTLSWNNSQSILGQQYESSGFIGAGGQDILQSPDTSGHGANGPGIRVEKLSFLVNTEIDASLPWTDYGSNGTAVSKTPVYRPLGQFGQPANDPLAPGWISNGKNGVASITATSSVICVPNTLGYVPTVGQTIMFPYLPTVVTRTVNSNTGSGCAGGFSASTLSSVLPTGAAYTVAQAEWFTGTAIQSTTTTIPTSITYPLTLTLTLPTNPIPGWPSNFASHGRVKVCGIEADYMGVNGYSPTYVIVLRKGPASSAGCSGTTPIAPINPCSAANLEGSSADMPWPVIPTINSGDSTPSGAGFYPGWCGGNFGISFPSLNANTYVGTGLVDSLLDQTYFDTAPGDPQGENRSGAVYLGGNYTEYAVTWNKFLSNNLMFGFAEGPSSVGQHGVTGVASTSAGMNWNDCSIHAGYPFILTGASQGGIHRCDTYTQEYSPYDGTYVGQGTGLYLSRNVDEQTGATNQSVFQFTVDLWNSEPEFNGGNADEIGVYANADCSYCAYHNDSFEGAFSVFQGDHQTVDAASTIAVPAINYGTANHFENIGNLNVGYILNKWSEGGNNNQFYNWGVLTSCSSNAGGSGAIQNCGAGYNQTYNGHSMESGIGGDYANGWQNTLGGQIRPGEWNISQSFDSFPMSTAFNVDESETNWGSYATCNISSSALCQSEHYPTTYIYVGPFNRIAPRTYVMSANVRMASSSNNVAVSISVFDDGSGNCANPASNIASHTFTVGTSWAPIYLPVSFATRSGCIMALQFGPGSATDTLQVGAVDFVPSPNWILGPTSSAPTEGNSCPLSNVWLGVFSGFSYYCDGGTVKRVAIS